MKLTRVCLVLACFLQFGVVVSRADEAESLTLADAQRIALRNHPKISEAQLEALASKQVANGVRAGFLPNVMFNATAVDAFEPNTRLAAGGLNNPSVYSRNGEGITVYQLLTDFGRTAHLLNSSRLFSRAQDENTEATREEILLQVDIAFFSTLKAQSVLEVAKQTSASRQLILDQVSALATNKLRSDLDLSFAKVANEEGRLLVAKADNDLRDAFAVLSQLLADRDEHSYRLVDEPMPTIQPTDATALVDTALANRPDLERLRLERDAATQFARAQKALSYPTISAFGSGGFIPVHDATHFEDQYAAAGVNLSLPLFDGGLNSAKRSEAELRADAAKEKIRDAENVVIHDVRSAALNVDYAAQRIELTRQLFDNATHAYELAEARYKLGSTSVVEFTQAQLTKTEADIAYTSAKYEYQIQRAILDFQVGVIR